MLFLALFTVFVQTVSAMAHRFRQATPDFHDAGRRHGSWKTSTLNAARRSTFDRRHLLVRCSRASRWVQAIAGMLMDIHVPVMNGHEATVELRKRHAPDALHIIALTSVRS